MGMHAQPGGQGGDRILEITALFNVVKDVDPATPAQIKLVIWRPGHVSV